MKKLIILLFLNFTIAAYAQISVGGNATSSAWTYGGYAGIGAGSGGTSIYITPRIGYKLVENFEMGMAGNFTWSNSSYHNSTMIGVGPFANYYLARTAYISGMFQEYFINYNNKTNNQNSSNNEAVLYLGGGYMQQLGNNAYMQIGAMYNVLYNPDKSVFSTGFIPQVGIVFGL
ncbi:MAG: hypothetical protein JST62_02365 [Bacteroidetes bacterium]|nr:hypothetical protein [Bacteroidota bacterium]